MSGPSQPTPASAGGATTTTSTRQLPINLFTRDSPLAIPPSTYFLPSQWKRYQLSELINKVLQNNSESGRQPIPFDFLVEGEILRGSLESWVKKHRGGDEETTVNVEYVRSLMPPTEVGRREVEDWVSGLSLARPGYVDMFLYDHDQTPVGAWRLGVPDLGSGCWEIGRLDAQDEVRADSTSGASCYHHISPMSRSCQCRSRKIRSTRSHCPPL